MKAHTPAVARRDPDAPVPRFRAVHALWLAAALALAGGGCFQLETRIRVNVDGSGTITERLRFSEGLLDMSRAGDPAADVARLLTREAALERMKQMGEGIRLVSHEVRPADQGARESVAVFHIADLNHLTYLSPYLGLPGYPQHGLKFSLFPVYKGASYYNAPGTMGLSYAAVGRGPRTAAAEAPPPLSPADAQVLRDLEPLLREMMTGLQVRITCESYAPLRFHPYYRARGKTALTREYDLINFSSDDLDNYGGPFLENEEVMLDLMKVLPAGANVVAHTRNAADNPSLPVLHPTGGHTTYFAPSRELFDQHFAGKVLHHEERHGGDQPARFEEIGFREAGPREAPASAATRPAAGSANADHRRKEE